MNYKFRGRATEEELRDIEREAGYETEILTVFPAVGPQETTIRLVLSGGTFYLVVLTAGNRYRVALSSF